MPRLVYSGAAASSMVSVIGWSRESVPRFGVSGATSLRSGSRFGGISKIFGSMVVDGRSMGVSRGIGKVGMVVVVWSFCGKVE